MRRLLGIALAAPLLATACADQEDPVTGAELDEALGSLAAVGTHELDCLTREFGKRTCDVTVHLTEPASEADLADAGAALEELAHIDNLDVEVREPGERLQVRVAPGTDPELFARVLTTTLASEATLLTTSFGAKPDYLLVYPGSVREAGELGSTLVALGGVRAYVNSGDVRITTVPGADLTDELAVADEIDHEVDRGTVEDGKVVLQLDRDADEAEALRLARAVPGFARIADVQIGLGVDTGVSRPDDHYSAVGAVLDDLGVDWLYDSRLEIEVDSVERAREVDTALRTQEPGQYAGLVVAYSWGDPTSGTLRGEDEELEFTLLLLLDAQPVWATYHYAQGTSEFSDIELTARADADPVQIGRSIALARLDEVGRPVVLRLRGSGQQWQTFDVTFNQSGTISIRGKVPAPADVVDGISRGWTAGRNAR